ncbi:MAG: glycosyltransferase family 2 protein [Chitinophagales bacterium]|nr:glycosyltransferase family 2 protein [Chitinophagales bacterium]
MSATSSYELSIITPCYNPVLGWEETYLNAYKNISNQLSKINIEWILVNDGSDKNININQIEQLKIHISDLKYFHYEKNQGKGFAIRYGVNQASTSKIIFTDIDFPYLDENVFDIYSMIQSGHDIVIGNRSQNYYEHLPSSRKRISKLLKLLMKYFLRIAVKDTQAGIKGFNVKGKEILLKTTVDRYLFDLELIKLATKNKLKIAEIAVELKSGIIIPPMNNKILLKEFFNFLKIAFK